jgi:hypothetical protein
MISNLRNPMLNGKEMPPLKEAGKERFQGEL